MFGMTSPWHTLEPIEVVAAHHGDAEHGLGAAEAKLRLERHGPNQLVEHGGKGPWRILAAQFAGMLVLILLAAALISLALGDAKDAIAIAVIVVLNAFLGFRQEYKAERAMAALKALATPRVRVRRGGKVLQIESGALVPGDIVLLDAGSIVPADGRLLRAASLKVQEAALTGESEAVLKSTEALAGKDLPVGDRRNMIYMGTSVRYGRGEAVVTETGMKTELGHIARLLQKTEEEVTPLARKLDRLGRRLVAAALLLIGLFVIAGFLRGEHPRTLFLTAISMAVAAVPEGLPAVVTISLSLGAQRMLARHALIRKLPAVETLGSVTTICSDKTGTLTQNRMRVNFLRLPSRQVQWDPGTFGEPGPTAADDGEVALLLAAGALCNDATIAVRGEDEADFEVIGDPTEGALVAAELRTGIRKDDLEQVLPRIGEAPFDSERKRMATLHRITRAGDDLPAAIRSVLDACSTGGAHNAVVFSKGAVDTMLEVCTRIRVDGQIFDLDEARRRETMQCMETLAAEGIRVLGVAYRPLAAAPSVSTAESLERQLVFLGIEGMTDPLRSEVKDAVQTCLAAGIRPVMITGDHALIARRIGSELGMVPDDGVVVSGEELTRMSDSELKRALDDVSVYARVSPEHKLRLVEALQDSNQIVAMTGDGVNDAPALKTADIGVAMGVVGSDVSREASDLVLLDDNFATIVSAIREGRIIFDNLRRFIQYLLASNAGELLVMLAAPFLGMPIPLLPVQILWMNLVTDGLPALALGVEKGERDVMARPPRPPGAPIVDGGMALSILAVGFLMAILSLAPAYAEWTPVDHVAIASSAHGHPAPAEATAWQTMLFTTMVFTQLFLALTMRSTRNSLLKIGLFSNKAMLAAVCGSLVMHLGVIYVPFLQGFFKTKALDGKQLLLCVATSALILVVVEVAKWIRRASDPRGRSFNP
jgi:Ca2+-transporting ATPase